MTPDPADYNGPYCSRCGYRLQGLVDSSKCPECGRPLVEVLVRHKPPLRPGKRYRSKAKLFGLPVIHIAMGPVEGEPRGRARGIIAIGDIATGGIAIGGSARGVVAIGGMAVGLFSLGGLSIGALASIGGMAIGGLAAGGGAVGVLANGGGAAGVAAQGGGAFGLYTRDGRGIRGASRATVEVFQKLDWFFGPWPPTPSSTTQPMLVIAALTLAAALLIGLVAWIKLLREPGEAGPQHS